MTWRRCIVALTGLPAVGAAAVARILFLGRGTPERFRCWQPQVLSDRGMVRELLAVLAHEIRHIANKDIWVMQLADTISSSRRIMSLIVIAMAVNSEPIVLIREVRPLFLGVLLLILAPTLSGLLQLALPRNGEYDADLNGANLLGDSHALAKAMRKIDHLAQPFWR